MITKEEFNELREKGGRDKDKVMDFINENKDKAFWVTEVQKTTGITQAQASEILIEYERQGMLVSKKKGIRKYYAVKDALT